MFGRFKNLPVEEQQKKLMQKMTSRRELVNYRFTFFVSIFRFFASLSQDLIVILVLKFKFFLEKIKWQQTQQALAHGK